jgi:hypothetical protein
MTATADPMDAEHTVDAIIQNMMQQPTQPSLIRDNPQILRYAMRHFIPYYEDTMGLCANANYLVFRWVPIPFKAGKVLFSVARRGAAAVCHFATDRRGLKQLKDAARTFIDFVFWMFPWCRMILTSVNKASVQRLVEKLGFRWVADDNNGSIYAWAL